jgi:putative drug exporter of the RND superfamily
MASTLYRLGRWSFRHRRVVASAWVALLLVVAVLGLAFKGTTNSSFTVPGTQSQQALDLLDHSFPGTGGATARIVVAAPPGHTLREARYQRLLAPTLRLAARVPQSASTPASLRASVNLSKNGRIAYGDLHFTKSVDQLTGQTKGALKRVAEPLRRAGAQVEFSGGVITTGGTQSSGDLLGVIIALVVLVIAFGALAAALLPLVAAFCGVAIGLLGITALSGAVSLSSTAPTLATMLGLAVGIDYTLFIVSRHRQQLADGMDVEESAARAVATAGGAVCFAGLTVIIALCGLLVTGIPFLGVMGLAAAGTVAIAVLIALTLLPALMGFLGARLAKGKHARPDRRTMGERWAQLVTARPVVTIVGVVVLLGIVAIPALNLRLGLPDAGTKSKTDTERRAYDLLTTGFGPGFNGPLTIVVDTTGAGPVARRLAPEATAKGLAKLPDVDTVAKPVRNRAGTISIVSVTPDSGPSSAATERLVKRIRHLTAPVHARYGVAILVTGTTALNIDTSSKLSSALVPFLVLIIGLAMVLLLLVFRSVVIPVKAVLGFLLTIAAALGAAVFVFQEGHLSSLFGVSGTGPVLSFLPVLMIAILFGLAMDYEVFLVSRIHEAHLRGDGPHASITNGFRASARVVTAAAIIMIGVFSGFIAGDDPVVKSIGFALALGVLIDAFLVRMTFVPAVLALLGRRAWYLPGWLARRVPNVDIEGQRLTVTGAQG